MNAADLDLAAALRQIFRHPLVREELRAIIAETAPAAGETAEGFIGTREAARRLGLRTKAAVVGMIERGVLPATKIPGSRGYRIRPADVDAVLSGQHTGAEPPSPIDLRARAAARADKLAATVKNDGGNR